MLPGLWTAETWQAGWHAADSARARTPTASRPAKWPFCNFDLPIDVYDLNAAAVVALEHRSHQCGVEEQDLALGERGRGVVRGCKRAWRERVSKHEISQRTK